MVLLRPALGLATLAWVGLAAATAEAPGPGSIVARETFDAALLARAVFDESNRVRRELGLREFQGSDAADEAAMIQARLGFVPGQSGHTNPFPAVATPHDRVIWTGMRPMLVSENVARVPVVDTGGAVQFGIRDVDGRSTAVDLATGAELPPHTYASLAADAVRRWMASPPHRANLVNPKLEILGCAAQMPASASGIDMVNVVQVFVKAGRGRGR